MFEENKHQINASLKSSVEQDSMNIANSISSEHQNNQISEVKQEKRSKQVNIYSMKNKAHGGRIGTHVVSDEPNKYITTYSDGYRTMYDKITKTMIELPKIDFTKCKNNDIWSYKN